MQPSLRQFDACRVRHADVLEWLWFLNSHRKPVFDWMWGDKDTYRLAFALAGKADSFQLVCSQSSRGPDTSPLVPMSVPFCLWPFAFASAIMCVAARMSIPLPLLPLHLFAYSTSTNIGQTMHMSRKTGHNFQTQLQRQLFLEQSYISAGHGVNGNMTMFAYKPKLGFAALPTS